MLEDEESTTGVPASTGAEYTPICNVIARNNDVRRFSTMLCAENQSGAVTALLDTGSDLNVINPDVVSQFEQMGLIIINKPVTFQTAGGKNSAPF